LSQERGQGKGHGLGKGIKRFERGGKKGKPKAAPCGRRLTVIKVKKTLINGSSSPKEENAPDLKKGTCSSPRSLTSTKHVSKKGEKGRFSTGGGEKKRRSARV